jgi:hypothetical protein
MPAAYADALAPPRSWGKSGAAIWSFDVIWPQAEPEARPAPSPVAVPARSPGAFHQGKILEQEGESSGGAFDRLSRMEEDQRAALRDSLASLSHPWAGRIAHRISALLEATREEHPDQPLISVPSLQGFLRFLQEAGNLRYPDTTISPQGNIRAEWKVSNERHLAIEFTSATETRFAVVGPDPKILNKTAKVAGVVSRNGILKTLEPYRASQWIFENAG